MFNDEGRILFMYIRNTKDLFKKNIYFDGNLYEHAIRTHKNTQGATDDRHESLGF